MKWIFEGSWLLAAGAFVTGVAIICVMLFVRNYVAPKQQGFPRYVVDTMAILMEYDQKPGSSYTITSTNVEIIINWK